MLYCRQVGTHDEDHVNADEGVDSLVGYLSRCIKSMHNVGTDNGVRRPHLLKIIYSACLALLVVVHNVGIGQQQQYTAVVINTNGADWKLRPEERGGWDSHVHVRFPPSGVVNGQWIKEHFAQECNHTPR